VRQCNRLAASIAKLAVASALRSRLFAGVPRTLQVPCTGYASELPIPTPTPPAIPSAADVTTRLALSLAGATTLIALGAFA